MAEKEYIEREYVLKCMEDSYKNAGISAEAKAKMTRWLNKAPAADVRPVVLCKDCQNSYEWANMDGGYYRYCGYLRSRWNPDVDRMVDDDDFCKWGQKEGGKLMYEALVARVRYHIQKANFMGLKEAESTLLLGEAADAIEELQAAEKKYLANIGALETENQHLKREREWIPVTERLPKEADGMVFVLMPDVFPYNSKQPFVDCDQDRRIEIAHYSEHSRKWYFGDCCAVGGQEPIAWIHRNVLPQPPKEE